MIGGGALLLSVIRRHRPEVRHRQPAGSHADAGLEPLRPASIRYVIRREAEVNRLTGRFRPGFATVKLALQRTR